MENASARSVLPFTAGLPHQTPRGYQDRGLSRELEKATGNQHTALSVNDDQKQTKAKKLEKAGISQRTANRYEELAGQR